jgi:hypothetical protein
MKKKIVIFAGAFALLVTGSRIIFSAQETQSGQSSLLARNIEALGQWEDDDDEPSKPTKPTTSCGTDGYPGRCYTMKYHTDKYGNCSASCEKTNNENEKCSYLSAAFINICLL